MSTAGYQIRDQFAVHFLKFATVQWVRHCEPLLKCKPYKLPGEAISLAGTSNLQLIRMKRANEIASPATTQMLKNTIGSQ